MTEAEDNEKAAATELEVALAQLGDASVKVQALTTENEKLKKVRCAHTAPWRRRQCTVAPGGAQS